MANRFRDFLSDMLAPTADDIARTRAARLNLLPRWSTTRTVLTVGAAGTAVCACCIGGTLYAIHGYNSQFTDDGGTSTVEVTPSNSPSNRPDSLKLGEPVMIRTSGPATGSATRRTPAISSSATPSASPTPRPAG